MAALALVTIASQWVQVMNKSSMHMRNQVGQADNVARAGLVDAISWFKRQTCQPVAQSCGGYTSPDLAFYPRVASNDTIDETVGLVREYPLTADGFLWAHYEVRRSTDVHDVSAQRVSNLTAGSGYVWQITSTGYVYRRFNPSVAYNVAPNQMVGTAQAVTEIRRVGLNVPGGAALTVVNGSGVTIINKGVVSGNSGPGLSFTNQGTFTTAADVDPSSKLLGTPVDQTLATPISEMTVFSMSPTDLKSVADYVYAPASMPANLPSMAISYVNGSVTFDATHQLVGSGILYVNGDLTVLTCPNTLFSGVVYATGNINITGPGGIYGAIIGSGATATTNVQGYLDVFNVMYDPNLLQSVRQQIGKYRETKSERWAHTQL